MGLLNRVRAAVSPSSEEERAVDAADFGIAGSWHTASGQSAGEYVDVDVTMRAAMGAVVRLLADDISTLPWKAYRKKGDERVEIAKPKWMVNPSGARFDTSVSHVSDAVVSLLTDGNLFIAGNPNTINPSVLYVLDPAKVDIIDGSGIAPRYRVGTAEYGQDSIAHVPWVRKPGSARGYNVVELARESTALEVAARKWAGNFFANGATVGGVIELPAGPRKVTLEELLMMKKTFEQQHRGNDKSHITGFLTNGAKYNATTIRPGEAELDPLWNHVLEEACRVFHVPTHLLASTSGSNVGANVEQRNIEYVQHAIRPIVTRLESVYSELLPGPNTYVRFNVDALLRGDAKTRAEASAIEIQNGVITRDEWRSREDMQPAPDGEGGYLRTPNNTMPDPRYEELSKLIQSGFDPEESLEVLGLPKISHLGNTPTTLYTDEGSNGAGRPPEDDTEDEPEADAPDASEEDQE